MNEIPQEMLKSLLENAPNLVLVVGKDGKVQHAVGGRHELNLDALIGASPLDFIDQEYTDTLREAIEIVFRTGTHRSFELKAIHLSGEIAWYTTAAGPIERDGEVVAVSLFATDVTDRKRAEQELAKAKDELLSKQKEAIMELSTPVIQIWDGIVILPLIGAVDTARAQQILESLLQAVSTLQVEVAIIDITGVSVVDTLVANHFLKTIEATKMLGTKTILTGVSPHNAQTLVQLGVDLSSITTKGSLMSGLKLAFEMTDKVVQEKEEKGGIK